MTKKVIALNLDDLWLVWGVPTGLFLLIHLITAVVLVFFHADTSLLISGALLPICSGILMLIVSTAHTGFSFFQALRFGQTRRRALAQCMGVILFEGGCSLALISLLTALEHWLAPKFWMFLTGSQSLVWGIRGYAVPDSALADSTVSLPNHTLFIEDFFLSWWWFPVILLGCMALGIIIGAVTARFGRRGRLDPLGNLDGLLLWASIAGRPNRPVGGLSFVDRNRAGYLCPGSAHLVLPLSAPCPGQKLSPSLSTKIPASPKG